MHDLTSCLPDLYDTGMISPSEISRIKSISEETVAKHYNMPVDQIRSDIKIDKLPSIYSLGLRKIGGMIRPYVQKIGDILGLYKPDDKSITLDRSNLYDKKTFSKTYMHELIHKIQDKIGKMRTHTRKQLEEEAYSESEKLSSAMPMYSKVMYI